MTIIVLGQFFWDSSQTISNFTVVKSVFDICIKLLASYLALDALMAMLITALAAAWRHFSILPPI